MIQLRRAAFGLVLAAFVAALLWWFATIPEYRRDLYRCVPATATVLLNVQDPGERLPEWMSDPAIAGLAMALGAGSNITTEAGAAMLAKQVRQITAGETVVAYVPDMGPRGGPAWMLVCWLGGRATRTQWALKTGLVKGARCAFVHNGHVVWRIPVEDLPPGTGFYLGMPEGHLVACVARDPMAITDAFDAYDGEIPSVRAMGSMPAPARNAEAYGQYLEYDHAAEVRWTFEVLRADADQFELKMRVPWTRWPVTPGETNTVHVWNPAAPHSFFQLKADRGIAAELFRFFWHDRQALFDDLMNNEGVGALDVQLVQGAYAGRVRGLLLPTAVMAMPIRDEALANRELEAILNSANRLYRWGLVRHDLSIGDYRPVVMEGTTDSDYARMDLRERVACLITNHSFVVANNTEGLTNLLLSTASGVVAPPLDPTAALDVRVNLGAGVKSLRNILAVWSLSLDSRRPEQVAAVRANLNRTKDWLDAAAPLGVLRMTLRRDGRMADFHIRVGAGL